MDGWAGGLPPAAHDRIERQRSSGVAGSLLSAAGAAAIRAVDLAPVGEVFGCVVEQLAYAGGGCGIWSSGLNIPFGGGYSAFPNGSGTATLGRSGPFGSGGFGSGPFASGPFASQPGGYVPWTSPVLTTGSDGRNAGFGSYVHAVQEAWHGALDRMIAEAAALGADGVVGVRIRRTRLETATHEFTATGTAVRTLDASVSPHARSARDVWAAGSTAEEVAALIRSGWVPRGMAFGVSIATKHEDPLLKSQRSVWSGNVEIEGLTELVNAARHDARVQLTRRAAPLNGSDIVITGSSLGEFDTPCGEEADLHAEATFTGTVIAPGPMHAFRDHSATAAARRDVTTVIPLRDTTRGTTGR
ncbi:heavy metal-binding domain-containing protein [Curtobacterium sp. MCBD17_019]|uniref:heavy metal-binding domain-containing protein n=1 Tax=Curtobacterium sp. MCBD17_019 TaxID=2175669 RepID=UPI000DA9DF07|nr:heavy metal-binding domain-containing protein [Curtobacterium sp. MCBD17_019]PZE75736.1 hypothetical protein DEI82_07470 [Curtobacterium sp. MCBD17_019]